MGRTCLHCGKPLGNTTAICHDCRSGGVEPTEVIDVEEAVVERLERYFIVSSTRCANCGDLHGTVTVDGTTYTAADFDIGSIEEWHEEMDDAETWMRAEEETVRAALALLEDEWPRSVRAVRNHVL